MKDNSACLSSQSVEWYTPHDIIRSVVAVLKKIDLDPCSNSHNDPHVPAVRHYTANDDGLSQEWQGSVFMNPPYGSTVNHWMQKLSQEYHIGNVPEAVTLWKAATDTRAWGTITGISDRVCFIRGRLQFSGAKDPAPFPSVLFYSGPQGDLFEEVFSRHGAIWQCPQQLDTQQTLSNFSGCVAEEASP